MGTKRGFWTYALAAVLLLAAAAPTAAAEEEDNLLYCQSRYSNGSTKLDISDDCDAQKYVDEKMRLSAVAVVVGLLLCCFCCWAMPARLVCNCCGGNRANPESMCCGGAADQYTQEDLDEAYHTKGICKPRLLLVILVLCVVLGAGCLAVVYSGLPQVEDGWDSWWNMLTGGIDWMQGKVTRIKGLVTNPDGSYINGIDLSFIDDVETAINDADREVKKLKDDLEGGNRLAISTLSIGGLPLVVAVLVLLLALCKKREPWMNCCSCIIFPLALVAWLVCGVSTVFHVVTTDLCFEVGKIADGTLDGLVGGYLLVDACPQKELTSAETKIVTATRENLQNACAEMRKICDGSAVFNVNTPSLMWVCDTAQLQNGRPYCDSDVTGLRSVVQNMPLKQDPNGHLSAFKCTTSARCTPYDCATECARETERSLSSSLTSAMDQANRAYRAYVDEMKDLLNCVLVWRKVIGGYNETSLNGWTGGCTDLRDGVKQWRSGAALGGCCMTLLGIVTILGKKRFRKKPQADAKVTPIPDAP
eukprot:TRINITY_DN6473_c0_g2_i1.p1 TRINITY_DN6473_c0_g2~~TRINITY_DN6473_c0_g2_i1.p1  ORF type:complete len:558 (+),score=101.93 TRINITY_DN6473_c0_g2_i1:80-1675(+)